MATDGCSVRRACWPFWAVLVPQTINGALHLTYIAEFSDRSPFGDEMNIGQQMIYSLDGSIRIAAALATDWETCSALVRPSGGPPGIGPKMGGSDSLVITGCRTVPIDGTPESLSGYRKIVAFVPVDA